VILLLCVLLFRVYVVCPLSVLLPVLANKDVHIDTCQCIVLSRLAFSAITIFTAVGLQCPAVGTVCVCVCGQLMEYKNKTHDAQLDLQKQLQTAKKVRRRLFILQQLRAYLYAWTLCHHQSMQKPSWAPRLVGQHWSLFSQPSAVHQFTLRDRRYASCSVPVYGPRFRRYSLHLPTEGCPGWVDVSGWLHLLRWFVHQQMVTHPSTNRLWRWLTSLMRLMTLPTKPNCQTVLAHYTSMPSVCVCVFELPSRNLHLPSYDSPGASTDQRFTSYQTTILVSNGLVKLWYSSKVVL